MAILPYLQIIFAAFLTILILIQSTGASLSEAFGGTELGIGFHTRRGAEKIIFYATMATAFLFVGSVFTALVVA